MSAEELPKLPRFTLKQTLDGGVELFLNQISSDGKTTYWHHEQHGTTMFTREVLEALMATDQTLVGAEIVPNGSVPDITLLVERWRKE